MHQINHFLQISKFKLTLLLLALNIFGVIATTEREVDSLLRVYDNLITDYHKEIDKRQSVIDSIKRESYQRLSTLQKYDYNYTLYSLYRPYISDSAVHYLTENLEIANELQNSDLQIKSRLSLAYLLASIGLYKEAVDFLDEIDEKKLDDKLRITYYNCMEHTYGEMSYYSKVPALSRRYRHISNTYKDTLKLILPKNGDRYLDIQESDYRNIRDFKMALHINDLRLKNVSTNSPEYALICFLRSLTYKESGDWLSEQKWLLLSAITDLNLGITDNASSWELASRMYKTGDLQRAHQYINYSVNNSKLYNARLRYTQISEAQSIINNAYLIYKAQKEKQLRGFILFISFLTFLLLLSLIGIFLQNRKISKTNSKLNRLNWELSKVNETINNTNAELFESNQVKEEYIGHFLSLCSLYINKMDAYRKNVRKKLVNGQQKEIIEEVKSSDFIDTELKEFYTNFDRSFLRLYPDFVTEFNNLLHDDEKIILKRDELLNTELRIFALIRLGIDNSAKIAELLHYSAKTIYNYRANIKNKAKVSRNDFENRVKKIGTFVN